MRFDGTRPAVDHDRRHAGRADPPAGRGGATVAATAGAPPAPAGRGGCAAAARWSRGVVYLGVSFYQVWSTGRSDHAGPVDAIVVMGAAQYDGRRRRSSPPGSTTSPSCGRTGRAPLVVVTGGNRPGDRFTEAEASAAYLEEHGVPSRRSCSRTRAPTATSRCRAWPPCSVARGLDEVLIVTDPYHALRSRLIAGEVGLDAHVSPTPTSVVHGAEQTTPGAAGSRRRRPRPAHRLRTHLTAPAPPLHCRTAPWGVV